MGTDALGRHLFCGAKAADGKPYCAEHVAAAYWRPGRVNLFNPDRPGRGPSFMGQAAALRLVNGH